MKYTTGKFALAAVVAACCIQPAEAFDLVPDDWTAADTRRQAAYTTILVIDAGQTADISNHDDISEANPVLRGLAGDNPSQGAVAGYFAAVGLAHYAISAALPPKHRRIWQHVTIGVNGAVVANNFRIGLTWGF